MRNITQFWIPNTVFLVTPNETDTTLHCTSFVICLNRRRTFPHSASEEGRVLRPKVQSRLPLNFARKLLQNGISLWFEPVISDASATLAVGSASYSFSGKQENQQKSAEMTSFTEMVNRKQAYSLTYKYSHYN
jgi:hypothetical protein